MSPVSVTLTATVVPRSIAGGTSSILRSAQVLMQLDWGGFRPLPQDWAITLVPQTTPALPWMSLNPSPLTATVFGTTSTVWACAGGGNTLAESSTVTVRGLVAHSGGASTPPAFQAVAEMPGKPGVSSVYRTLTDPLAGIWTQ